MPILSNAFCGKLECMAQQIGNLTTVKHQLLLVLGIALQKEVSNSTVQWQIQNFQEEGVPTIKVLFSPTFPQNCRKMKKKLDDLAPPLDPPMLFIIKTNHGKHNVSKSAILNRHAKISSMHL